jgi:hypothetical protein
MLHLGFFSDLALLHVIIILSEDSTSVGNLLREILLRKILQEYSLLVLQVPPPIEYLSATIRSRPQSKQSSPTPHLHSVLAPFHIPNSTLARLYTATPWTLPSSKTALTTCSNSIVKIYQKCGIKAFFSLPLLLGVLPAFAIAQTLHLRLL